MPTTPQSLHFPQVSSSQSLQVSDLSTYYILHTPYSLLNPSFRLQVSNLSPYYILHTLCSNPAFLSSFSQTPSLLISPLLSVETPATQSPSNRLSKERFLDIRGLFDYHFAPSFKGTSDNMTVLYLQGHFQRQHFSCSQAERSQVNNSL
jgi:hypothetical protein